MIDYTNNFPLPELRPEGTLLQLQAYSATPSFQAVWQGEGTILDRNRIADPTAWGYDNDQREAMTRDEYYNATQLMSAEAGTNTGIYGEYINSVLGKDVNKGAVLRSIYFGADPLNAMPFGPSELPQTEEEVKELESSLNTLLAGEAGQQTDPKNLTPNQKRIKEISDKLLYKKALETTDQNLGISFSRQILAQSEWISFATDKLGITDPTETAKIARDLEDITRIRTRVDPKFNPTEWFDKTYSDPIVQQGLLDNGITSALIANAPNEDEAKFRIYRSLLQGDLQKRMATYSPTWTDNIRLASSSLVAGFVNSPDIVIDAGEIAGGVALSIGSLIASPFTGGTSLAGTVGGAAMATTGTTNLFLKLKTIWQASKALRGSYYAAETVLKLPMGFAPSYAKNLGLLGRVVTPTLMGFSGGALTEYARQQSEMAYAAATLYADPDAVKDYNMSEVAFVGIQSGMFGGALFGLAPNVVSSAFGATMNKFKGVNVAAPGEPVFRNTLDKRFTFKGTVVGEAVDYYGGILRGKKTPVAIDGPLQETLATKAELERKNPTAQEVIKETETRVDRVETSNVETPDRAESIPDTPALKRYENESKAGYIRRVAGLKEVSNIFQLVRELARRSPEASDNLKTATDDWDKMSPVDRIRVLTDASDHIKNLLDIESKLEGGLAPGRAKAIETLEKQRKTLIRNISKNLTADQIKALKKELKGEAVLELPKALAEARNNSATTAARKAAASDLAAKLVEKAQQAAKDKEQADAVRNAVPQDLLDSFDEVSTEVKLTGSVSETTIAAVKNRITGLEEKTASPNIIQRAIKQALAIKKFNPDRIDKVKQIIENPTKITFSRLISGDKINAAKFFDLINDLRIKKLITTADFEFILASTVHLNFSNRAFALDFKLETITDPDTGTVRTDIAGQFDANTNTLRINDKFFFGALSLNSSKQRAMTVLHELGHAFFYHNAKGDAYLNTLKLYRNTLDSVGMVSDIRQSSDVLLAADFLDSYTLTGAEETFVETFSKILFTEGQAAIDLANPVNVSFAQSALNKIAESVVLAATMLDQSKHYEIASKVMDSILDLDKKLSDNVSVPKMVFALRTAYMRQGADLIEGPPNAIDRVTLNKDIQKLLGTNKYDLSDLEFEMVTFMHSEDPSFLVAFAIAKSEGKTFKTQEDFDYLVSAYSDYKRTQFVGVTHRITTALIRNQEVLRTLVTQEERLSFLKRAFLDPSLSELGAPTAVPAAAPITYEDLLLQAIPISVNRQDYGLTYLEISAQALRDIIDGNGFDTTKFDASKVLSKPIIEHVRDYFTQSGLDELASQTNIVASRLYLESLKQQGIFNIIPPKWTTADEAKAIIADLLESKTDLATVFAILQSQLDPNLLKTLLDNVDSETKLLTGIYNGLDKGLFSYNDKSGKWEIAKKTKKKKTPAKKKEVKAEVVKPAEPIKTPEQNETEALAEDSEVVTMENFKEYAIKISNELNTTRDKEGYTLKSVEQALVYVSKVILDEAPELVKLIENGSVNSVVKLRKAILAKGKNVLKDEGREVRTLTQIDPVTGEKIKVKVRVGSLESKTGKTIEGGRIAGRMEKIDEDGLERENTIALVENIEKVLQYIPNFLSEPEVELITVLKTKPIKQEAAKVLGVSSSTVTRRDAALRTKLDTLFIETGLNAEDLKDPLILKDTLEAWAKNKDAAVKEATTKAPKPKDVVNTEKKKPAKPTPNAEEAGARILETAAKAAQLANTDPPHIPVPKTTTEPTMVRVTTDLTGNQPEDVIRPEVQGDALIAGTDTSVKEAVKFTPKNPLKTSFQNSTELEANPKKKAGLLTQAARGGFDAVVFQDGSMIPINKDDVVVVGRTESTTPPGIETVVTVTKEKGIPVKRKEPKPKTPKSIGDGDPVTLTKNGQPKRKQPEQKKSDVVDETEVANIERKVNEDREALRASGLDTNSLKKFLSFYWKKMKEIDKEGGTYTTLFKTMWNKFVTINAEIYEANLKLVGEDGIKAFWKKVDELRALDKHKLATVPGHKLRTDASIFAEAGRSVNDNFIPFITPNELTIKKVGEEYVFSSSVKRVRTIVAANKTEAPIPVPPTPAKPVEGTEAKPPKEVRMPEPDEDELKDRETLIEQGWQKAEQGASTPLRLTNLIGFIFGGSNRESANWWRQTMNWMRNSSQLASSTGRTIQSMQGKIRFIARMFDDVKAQTGHLVMAGKSAFRTAMQCASDEGRIIGRISKYQMRLYRNLNKMPDQRKNLMLTVWRRLSEGADLTVADVAAAGIPASMRAEITKQANDLLMIVRQVNKTFLDLEMETGLVNTVDSMGNPVDPNKWATVQLDHEKLSRLSPSERAELINKLVAARTQRKLSSELLDINTMIVLGWLDIAPSAQHQGTALLAGDRKFRRGPTVNSFDKATLSNLDTGIVHPIGVDPKKILQDLANRGEPDRFFVLEENGTLKVYEIPRKVSQLSDADKAKYLDAVRGNTSLYTQRWRDYLQGKSLTEFEMIQTLDFKTKRGYYSDYNSKNGTNIDRPLMKTGTDETVALAVPGLVPEEVLAFKEITDVMRINLAESYFYFLKGRMFELLFQRELDRLMGTTGIKITDVLDWAYRSVEKDLQDMQKSQGWTKEQYEARVQELRIGLSRIREEYASYADTLPLLFNPEMYVSRASMAFMKMKVAVGYGVSALTETIIEYGKTNPLRIPSEIVKSLRYIMGDLRFSKSAILEEDAGTLLFMLENFRHEHSSRFLGEVAHGAFELDNKLRTKFINSTTPINSWDKTVRAAEVGGRVAESIGSLQALTNMVRGMGVRRWQARIWKHISKGRIQRFLAAMEDPKMARLMEQLFASAENNPIDERRLWKQFAAEARKAGFGFDYREAMLFMTYGLNSVEKIRHLEYLIRQAGGSNRGVVNIDRMADIYWNHRNNPQPGIDNKILEEVLSSYAYFLNNITMRTTSAEPAGIGRITSLDSKTPLGRLWYALTSWIRGYQDQVILNYAYRSTLGFVAGNILLLGVVDALIGMFREWLAGRETEDMLEEFEENPESFAIRVLRAAPIMGAANGIFEGVLSGINALSGGVWRSYNNPMSSIGINAAASSIEDIGRGISELTGQITGEDPVEPAKLVAAGGKIIPYNSLFNRSPIAVPARFIEDMGYLDQRGAVQQYLNLIQREPYPYAKSKGKAGRAGASAITMQPPPRNIAKEMAEFERLEAARPKVSQSLKDTIKTEIVNDQKGVSGRLGELLK
jgi:hypothetical protein